MVDVQKLINNNNNNSLDCTAMNTLSDISLGSGQTKGTDSSGYASSLSRNGHSRTCLIVNYLPQSVKEQQFRQIFAQIGRLRYCRLMSVSKSLSNIKTEFYFRYDRATGYSYGYGFVDYYRAEDAAKGRRRRKTILPKFYLYLFRDFIAIDTLNQLKMEHKTIKVSYARPKCDETRGTNLYIRNLPGKIFILTNKIKKKHFVTEKYDENKLIELFSPYGEIIQARVIRDQSTENPRGIAFVIMGTRSQAQRAGREITKKKLLFFI